MGKYDELKARLKALAIDICLGRDVRKRDGDITVNCAVDAIEALEVENERLRKFKDLVLFKLGAVVGILEASGVDCSNIHEALKGTDHETGE